MSTGGRFLTAVAVVAVLGIAAWLSYVRGGDRGVAVRMETVQTRDLVSFVTASGNIRPRRTVDISSDISAKVEELLVEEGDDVEAGELLLRLDPSEYEAARSRAAAALSQAQAQAANQRANLLQAQRTFDRLDTLYRRDSVLVSRQQLEDAETALEIARANLEGARFGVEQARASLKEAEDRLSKTTIRAPMAGRVTRLNVEEGETVLIGTMNNPGSLVLTVSDLSTVEVVVQVDETDVPALALGDSASVEIDAFPDRSFAGRVTEIGNSAIQGPGGGGGEASVDFEVVITLGETPVLLRPDLSATANIVTEIREQAVSIPIVALTVRERASAEEKTVGMGGEAASEAAGSAGKVRDVEGVFVVRDGEAVFTSVEVGIAGKEHFEVLAGVEVGQTIVSGPYQTVRELVDGMGVRPMEEGEGQEAGPVDVADGSDGGS